MKHAALYIAIAALVVACLVFLRAGPTSTEGDDFTSSPLHFSFDLDEMADWCFGVGEPPEGAVQVWLIEQEDADGNLVTRAYFAPCEEEGRDAPPTTKELKSDWWTMNEKGKWVRVSAEVRATIEEYADEDEER